MKSEKFDTQTGVHVKGVSERKARLFLLLAGLLLVASVVVLIIFILLASGAIQTGKHQEAHCSSQVVQHTHAFMKKHRYKNESSLLSHFKFVELTEFTK